MTKRLRVTTATGEPTTVKSMLGDAPRRINVAWSAQGVLLNVTPGDAVQLMHDLERQLEPHGFTHVEARVHSLPQTRVGGRTRAKRLAKADTRKEPGVCLWGLAMGAITRFW